MVSAICKRHPSLCDLGSCATSIEWHQKTTKKLTSKFDKCNLNNMNFQRSCSKIIHWTYKIKRKHQTSNKFLVTFCARVYEHRRGPCVLLFLHLHIIILLLLYFVQNICFLHNTPIHNNYNKLIIKLWWLKAECWARDHLQGQDVEYKTHW